MVGGQDEIGNPRTADEPPTGAQEAIHKLDLNVGGEQLRVSLRPVFQLTLLLIGHYNSRLLIG